MAEDKFPQLVLVDVLLFGMSIPGLGRHLAIYFQMPTLPQVGNTEEFSAFDK